MAGNEEFKKKAREQILKLKNAGYSKELIEEIAWICAATDDFDETWDYAMSLYDKKLSENEYFTVMMRYSGLEDDGEGE